MSYLYKIAAEQRDDQSAGQSIRQNAIAGQSGSAKKCQKLPSQISLGGSFLELLETKALGIPDE
jgi:hypothetical protein